MFDSLRGYKPRILNNRMEELLCCFLKVQVSWLLGAAGKAEIKNRKRGDFSKFKLLLQSNAAPTVGCYYSRREPEKKEKALLTQDFIDIKQLLIL